MTPETTRQAEYDNNAMAPDHCSGAGRRHPENNKYARKAVIGHVFRELLVRAVPYNIKKSVQNSTEKRKLFGKFVNTIWEMYEKTY